MPFPNLDVPQPRFDMYGSQFEISPLVSKGTAGVMAPGQTLFSCTLRENAPSSATATYPVLIVPANMCFFLTDFQANGAAIVAGAEIVLTILAGTVAITQVSLGNSSPISLQYETQPFATPGVVITISVTNPSATTPAFACTMAGYLQSFGF